MDSKSGQSWFLGLGRGPAGTTRSLPLERMRKTWRAGHSGVYSPVARQVKWKFRFITPPLHEFISTNWFLHTLGSFPLAQIHARFRRYFVAICRVRRPPESSTHNQAALLLGRSNGVGDLDGRCSASHWMCGTEHSWNHLLNSVFVRCPGNCARRTATDHGSNDSTLCRRHDRRRLRRNPFAAESSAD